MTIDRFARLSNATRRKVHCGPNKSKHCAECQTIKANGYLLRAVQALGYSSGIFICDECIDKARKDGSYRHEPEKN